MRTIRSLAAAAVVSVLLATPGAAAPVAEESATLRNPIREAYQQCRTELGDDATPHQILACVAEKLGY